MKLWSRIRIVVLAVVLPAATVVASVVVSPQTAEAAACTAPPADYGSATTSVNIPSTGNYKIWSRIQPSSSDVNHNSYKLEIDGNTCFAVGGGDQIPANAWTWVNYHDGNVFTSVQHNFSTTGNHTVKLIGNEPNAKLDRVIFTQDMSCVPTGTGDNCAEPPDSTPPAVSLTEPASNATVGGQVNVSANASDADSGVGKVEFYHGSTKIGEDASYPYSVSWNTADVANGSYNITARAINGQGLAATSAVRTITVFNQPQFSCSGSSVTVCQDFAAAPTGMAYTGGTWGVSGGKLTLTSPTTSGSGSSNFNTAILNQNISGDYDYTVESLVVASSGGSTNEFDDFSVIFGYQDSNNYYFASFNESNDGNTHGIFKVQAGNQTELTDFSGGIEDDRFYDVKIEKRGSAYKVYLDGQQAGSVTDAAFASGKVGMGSRNNEVRFDNMIVTAISAPTPGDSTAPTVSLTAPPNSATVSGNVTVSADASDNVGISKVEFYVDNQLKGIDSTFPYSISLNTTTLTEGDHTLTAKAFDQAGNQATSSARTVKVENVTARPEDINMDGKVDILDFSELASKFGQSGSSVGRTDINKDGKVDLIDFSLLSSEFGS